jgi:hypothetical protein
VALRPASRGRSKRATPDGSLGAFDGDKFWEPSEEEYAKSILHLFRAVGREPSTSVPSTCAMPHGEPAAKSRRTREVFSCSKVYVATSRWLLFPPRLRLPPTTHIRICDLAVQWISSAAPHAKAFSFIDMANIGARLTAPYTASFDPTQRFVTSWILSPALLFGVRALLSLYAFTTLFTIFGWNGSHGMSDQSRYSFSYFTHLTYWGLAFYFAFAAIHTGSYWLKGTSFLSRWPRALQVAHSMFYSTVVVYPFIVTSK